MRIIRNITPGRESCYLAQSLFAFKALEVGWQWLADNQGIDIRWSFTTRGDHAGLTFWVSLGRFLFEFKLYDSRHWSWRKSRWLEPGEEEFYDDGLYLPKLNVIHDDGPEPEEDCE